MNALTVGLLFCALWFNTATFTLDSFKSLKKEEAAALSVEAGLMGLTCKLLFNDLKKEVMRCSPIYIQLTRPLAFFEAYTYAGLGFMSTTVCLAAAAYTVHLNQQSREYAMMPLVQEQKTQKIKERYKQMEYDKPQKGCCSFE